MLPNINSLETYRPLYRDVAVWLPALQAICRRHDLDPDSLRQAPPGSNVVFWVDPGYLIKLFAPMWAADSEREKVILQELDAHPLRAAAGFHPFDTPHVVAEGSIEGWPYLILTRLAGQPMDEIWDGLEVEEQIRLAQDLGRLMAELHRVPTAGLEALGDDWPSFLAGQIHTCRAQQEELGTPSAWLGELETFLADLPQLDDLQPVFLHADLNPEHLFCQPGPEGWRITGMIDFGDAMLGHPYYEFVAPGHLLAAAAMENDGARKPSLLRRAMLLGYGFQPAELDENLSRRLLAFTLLHRFASLPDILNQYRERIPTGLSGLQKAFWDFEGS